METECKLAFKSEEELFGILDADWFYNICMEHEKQEAVKLSSTYYDTRDRRMTSRGGSIRVRNISDSDEEEETYEHTIKLGGKVDNGLHQRYEWNVKTFSKSFSKEEFLDGISRSEDPSDILMEALDGITEDNLEPLCKTKFNRTVYTLGYGDSLMEACFDVGKLSAGDKSEPICELELELISGDVVDLMDMANYIVSKTNAEFSNYSKFKRCLKLLEEE
ncbi:MAG: CYTH domain-containing protein [Clostridia bacterium]|nr:CYTH domain-containing protein [Clostridia bacterium]